LIEGGIVSAPDMQLSEATGWAVLAALVAIPLCYYFWKRWDHPTRAAKREQERRLEEREVRLIFLKEEAKEEAKAREAERRQAIVSLDQRKKHDAMPPSTETLSMALSSIDDEPMGEGKVPGVSSEAVAKARSAAEVAELESIPDSIAVPDIEPDESVPELVEGVGPIVLKVTIDLPEEVKTKLAETKNIEEEFDWPEWE
jgi:hypothetical protein